MSNRNYTAVMERLEGRQLFSGGADDPVIIADRQAISDDRNTLLSHRSAIIATLTQDAVDLRAALVQRGVDVAPLRQKYLDDRAAGVTQLLADRSALLQSLSDDRAVLITDVVAIRADRGNLSQLAIDLQKLSDDRATLLSHRSAGVTTYLNDRSTLVSTLLDDRQSIHDFLETDTPAITAARTKFSDDRIAGEQELNDDRVTLVDDIQKLRDDAVGHA